MDILVSYLCDTNVEGTFPSDAIPDKMDGFGQRERREREERERGERERVERRERDRESEGEKDRERKSERE